MMLTLFIASALVASADAPEDFVLSIGVNVAPGQAELRYADDDAARYTALFDARGAHTELLARFDENTARLHAALAQRVQPATRQSVDAASARLATAVDQARRAGHRSRLYVTYAGHGVLDDDAGALLLENGKLSVADIEQILDRVGADEAHVIVDACFSSFLAQGRGPGGVSRPVSGFRPTSGLLKRPNVGLLLSTSSAKESHEWGAIQAGVFHHEVQSGLVGAADVDGDGLVTYREMGAFISKANASVPNERYRPDVFARAPAGGEVLFAAPSSGQLKVHISSALASRYYIEDVNGLRWVDFHSGPTLTTQLSLPPAEYFVVDVARNTERRVSGTDVVQLAQVAATEPRVAERGAANEAFTRLFELPFAQDSVAAYTLPVVAQASGDQPVIQANAPRLMSTPRRVAAWTTLGGGIAAASAALVMLVMIKSMEAQAQLGGLSQLDAHTLNDSLRSKSIAGGVLLGVSVSAIVTSILLFVLPEPAAKTVLTVAGPTLNALSF